MTTINVADLVPFSSGCALLGIPLPSAERYLRTRPHLLPPVIRAGWERYFTRGDLARYCAVRLAVSRDLEQFAEERRWIARSRSTMKQGIRDEPGGPIFYFPFSATAVSSAVTAGYDLFCATAPSKSRVALRAIKLGQRSELPMRKPSCCRC